MKKFSFLVSAFLCCTSVTAFAGAHSQFMPENHLDRQDDLEAFEQKAKNNLLAELAASHHCPKPPKPPRPKPSPGPGPTPSPTQGPDPTPNPDPTPAPQQMTQAVFNAVSDQVIAAYKDYAGKQGGQLNVVKNWQDSTVNAYADQNGTNWEVQMFGGLARRPEITVDGFAMVVCHEVGHHLGGFPRFTPSDWAAVEGNADYWATRACGKKLWLNAYKTNARRAEEARHKLSFDAVSRCEDVYGSQGVNQVNLCLRLSSAGQSLANLLSVLDGGPVPNYDTPDQTVVTKTYPDHPAAQCRLDTYQAGFLCTKALLPAVLTKTEAQDAVVSCNEKEGSQPGLAARPRCWFKPGL